MEARSDDLRSLIENLIDAQVDAARLATRVMLLQELADAAQSVASMAFDQALEAGGDPDAIDWAVATGSAASRANVDELEATIAWKAHLEQTDKLVATARSVLASL